MWRPSAKGGFGRYTLRRRYTTKFAIPSASLERLQTGNISFRASIGAPIQSCKRRLASIADQGTEGPMQAGITSPDSLYEGYTWSPPHNSSRRRRRGQRFKADLEGLAKYDPPTIVPTTIGLDWPNNVRLLW